jgi:hypothetical protein
LRGPSGSGERGRDRGNRALHVVAETSRWVIARRTFGVAVSETPTPPAASIRSIASGLLDPQLDEVRLGAGVSLDTARDQRAERAAEALREAERDRVELAPLSTRPARPARPLRSAGAGRLDE